MLLLNNSKRTITFTVWEEREKINQVAGLKERDQKLYLFSNCPISVNCLHLYLLPCAKVPLTLAHRVRVCTQHLICIQTVLRLVRLAKEDDQGNPKFLRSLNLASES